MLLAEYLLKYLKKKKIRHIFLLTGGAVAFLIDKISKVKKLKGIPVVHEQSAAMMADAYSRVGPNISAAIATTGPGATNLITGIACSWFDSVPSLFITGQVRRDELTDFQNKAHVRQTGFQETDIVSIARPITKFAYQLRNANEIKFVMEKAIFVAQSGRPGPVLIDVPMDLQKTKINEKKLKKFLLKKNSNKKKNIYKDINRLKILLVKSKKPAFLIGGGIRISRAFKELNFFLNKFKIPIITTWSGFDSIAYNNPFYAGTIGVYGSRAANLTAQNSDLLICLGSRLDTRVVGSNSKDFARNAKIVLIDIDNAELTSKSEKGFRIHHKINSDLKTFFLQFHKIYPRKIKLNLNRFWIETISRWKRNYPNIKKEYYLQKKYVNPYVFFSSLSNHLKSKDTIIASTGAHITWAIQSFKIKNGQRFFSAQGHSPMGYALPASIGASFALNKRRVICIDGDGSFQLNIQELQTIKEHKLPIKIFLINNCGYGIIRQFQELYLGSRFIGSSAEKGVTNPDFKKIIRGYGINYNKIKKNSEINSVLKNVLKSKKSEFIEIFVDPAQKIFPKLEYGRKLEDLSPVLPREEFFKLNDSLK